MLIGKFHLGGKLPRNKSFNYVPVYFDPEKGELEKRIKEIKSQNLPANQRERTSIKFERHLQSKREERKVYISRLTIIVFLTALILFFIFK